MKHYILTHTNYRAKGGGNTESWRIPIAGGGDGMGWVTCKPASGCSELCEIHATHEYAAVCALRS